MKTLLLSLLLVLPGAAGARELLVENFLPNGVMAGPKTRSDVWTAELGELVGRHGTAWARAEALRLLTRRDDFKSVSVSFDLLVRGLDVGSEAQQNPWDGVQLWLRYVSEDCHYYAAVSRRDNTLVIKKKASGTYFTLGPAVPYAVPFNSWQSVRATINDNPDGTVTIAVYLGDALLATVTDNGSVGGPPIHQAGRVGLRADNCEFDVAHFVVEDFEKAAPPRILASSMTVSASMATIYWSTDRPSDSEVDYGVTTGYGQLAVGGWTTTHQVVLGGLSPDTVYHCRLRSKTGPGGVVESPDLTFRTTANVDVSSPTVTFTAPAAGQPVSGVVTAAATAADDTGVAGVQFFLDGKPLGAEIAAPPYTQTFATVQFPDGNHELTAVARDAAGNRGAASMTVTIGVIAGQIGSDPSTPVVVSTDTGAPNLGSDGAPAPVDGSTSGGSGSSSSSSTPPPPTVSTSSFSGPVIGLTPATPGSPDGARAPEKFLTPARADGINDVAHFGPAASRISVFDLRGRKIVERAREGAAALVWDGRNAAGRLVEAGVYIVKIIKDGGSKEFQALAVAK